MPDARHKSKAAPLPHASVDLALLGPPVRCSHGHRTKPPNPNISPGLDTGHPLHSLKQCLGVKYSFFHCLSALSRAVFLTIGGVAIMCCRYNQTRPASLTAAADPVLPPPDMCPPGRCRPIGQPKPLGHWPLGPLQPRPPHIQ